MEPKIGTGLSPKVKPYCKEIIAEFRDFPDGLKVTLLENDFMERPYPVAGRRVKVYMSLEGDILGLKFLD